MVAMSELLLEIDAELVLIEFVLLVLLAALLAIEVS